MAIAEIALVRDMSGVCRSRDTRVITPSPMKVARTKTKSRSMNVLPLAPPRHAHRGLSRGGRCGAHQARKGQATSGHARFDSSSGALATSPANDPGGWEETSVLVAERNHSE